MEFDHFTDRAREILAEVPNEYLSGIAGVLAHRRAEAHPHLPGIFTLGECAADEVTALGDPAALVSRIHLYHGSFAAIARRDPTFDWEAELKETILHEIQHHLEDRAGVLDLLEEDAFGEALSHWYAGQALGAGWYRRGERLEEAVWRVADDLFVELRVRPDDFATLVGTTARLTVLGEPLEADLPEDLSPDEILTFEGEGLARPTTGHGALHLILRTE